MNQHAGFIDLVTLNQLCFKGMDVIMCFFGLELSNKDSTMKIIYNILVTRPGAAEQRHTVEPSRLTLANTLLLTET